MAATMPCQAPFQHQMCFVRSLTKLGVGRHDSFFPPNAFHKTFHRRVSFANDSCCLPRSLSISNHTKALGPVCLGRVTTDKHSGVCWLDLGFSGS